MALGIGKQLHSYVVRGGIRLNVYIGSSLISMYSECREFGYVRSVFSALEERNITVWNGLIQSYINEGRMEKAWKAFNMMQEDGLEPDIVTYNSFIDAYARTGQKEQVYELLSRMVDVGFKRNVVSMNALISGLHCHGLCAHALEVFRFMQLSSHGKAKNWALIDMYGKCGKIEYARLVFKRTLAKDMAVWNALMYCYLLHRMPRDVINLFNHIEQSGIQPDPVSFIILLSACKQGGFIEEARNYFYTMEDIYGIKPTLKHYTCMIDIMGTLGLLEESLELIQKMPLKPDACLWSTVLKACKLNSNLEIGEKAATALYELEPNNTSNYMVLSNIYANTGLWDSTEVVRDAMTEQGLHVQKQCSWLYLGTTVHAFEAGDFSHPAFEKILCTWKDLASRMEQSGYSSQDIELYCNVEVDPLSCHHTERIAVCFGLISVCAPEPVRISKNFRMCKECHWSFKFISGDKNREIFVSDGSTYHHFRDGACSCGDTW